MNGVISGDTLIGTINTECELTGILSNPKNIDLSADTITPEDLRSGVKAHNSSGTQITGSMVDNGAVEGSISTKDEEYTIPEGYHNGNGKVGIDSSEQAKIIPENIKKDVSILGITGTLKGGYGYTKIAEKDITYSTTSTSATLVDTLDCGEEVVTKSLVYVRIRDKEGHRNGYFLGTDNFFANVGIANRFIQQTAYGMRCTYRYAWDQYNIYIGNGNTAYGLYAYSISPTGVLSFYSRYSNNNSLTIDSTYHVEVYVLDYPDGITPYDI